MVFIFSIRQKINVLAAEPAVRLRRLAKIARQLVAKADQTAQFSIQMVNRSAIEVAILTKVDGLLRKNISEKLLAAHHPLRFNFNLFTRWDLPLDQILPDVIPEKFEKRFVCDELMRLRQSMDPIYQGKRVCLRCDRVFFSADLKKNKICNRCSPGRFEEAP